MGPDDDEIPPDPPPINPPVVTGGAIIELVEAKTSLDRPQAKEAVGAILGTITESLSRGDEVTFRGFGKFSTQRRAARQGINPRNPSEKVSIPAATVPKFSAASSLKAAVREG